MSMKCLLQFHSELMINWFLTTEPREETYHLQGLVTHLWVKNCRFHIDLSRVVHVQKLSLSL